MMTLIPPLPPTFMRFILHPSLCSPPRSQLYSPPLPLFLLYDFKPHAEGLFLTPVQPSRPPYSFSFFLSQRSDPLVACAPSLCHFFGEGRTLGLSFFMVLLRPPPTSMEMVESLSYLFKTRVILPRPVLREIVPRDPCSLFTHQIKTSFPAKDLSHIFPAPFPHSRQSRSCNEMMSPETIRLSPHPSPSHGYPYPHWFFLFFFPLGSRSSPRQSLLSPRLPPQQSPLDQRRCKPPAGGLAQ